MDVELEWDVGSQQFLICKISYEDAPSQNQPPTANAGPDLNVNPGETAVIEGQASWSWQRVSGLTVTLQNANTNKVRFTAPGTTGTIVLRQTVTDDEGATDSDDDGATDTDDVIITVESVSAPDNTTGSTVPSMLPIINADRGQVQHCNGPASGSGDKDYGPVDPLSWSSSLAEIAKLHSMDMAREGYFSHTSLDGTSMGTRVFAYWSGNRVGENIAASSVNRSDSYVVNLWLTSTGGIANCSWTRTSPMPESEADRMRTTVTTSTISGRSTSADKRQGFIPPPFSLIMVRG